MQVKKLPNKNRQNNKQKNNNIDLIMPSSGNSYINLMVMGEIFSNITKTNVPQLIVSTISSKGCNIVNIKITEFGEDFILSALINGKWNNIIKLEKYLSGLIKKYSLNLCYKRNNSIELCKENESKQPHMHYMAQAITIDKPGILDKLLQFFNTENIQIKEVNIHAHANNLNLVNIQIQLKITAISHIVSLRERFLSYCDVLNLDSSLEPV
jgi:glycine cleavage system transcriptional repressor